MTIAIAQTWEVSRLNNGTSITVTYDSSTAVDNLLTAFCSWASNTFSSLTDDSGSNTWLLETERNRSSGSAVVNFGKVKNGATGTHGVTLTVTGSNDYIGLGIAEYSGSWGTNPFDVEEWNKVEGSSHGALDVNDLPVATTVADALLLGGWMVDRVTTAPTDWTTGGQFDQTAVHYRIVSSTGSYAASASYATNINNSVGMFVAYGESGGAPADQEPALVHGKLTNDSVLLRHLAR